jgi:hypothetical protein
MDDFNVSSLHESKNEWGARLLIILTPLVIEGLKSIFDESYKLCKDNGELDKYLMTYQNFIARIPKWNSNIIEQERKRIIEKSGCSYLEELVTCIHIIQLKLLTAMRVGQKQKKIDIKIPKLDDFIHKMYINVARKVYKNVYLFEHNLPPLQVQKNNRELEIIVQECILNSVRDSIPIENILRAYMDETVEEEVIEEIKEQIIESVDKAEAVVISEDTKDIKDIKEIKEIKEPGKLTFNDIDNVYTKHGTEELINAPKNIERLEEISALRNMQRKIEEETANNDDIITISNEDITLDEIDMHDFGKPVINPNTLFLDDIEILD